MRLTLALCLIFALVFSSLALASGYETKLKIKGAIGEGLSLSSELRLARDFSEINYRHLDVGMQVRPLASWQLAAHYRGIEKKSASRHWLSERRWYLQAERSLPAASMWLLPGCHIKIRSRWEARYREGKDRAYRQRLRIKLKAKNKRLAGLKPFVSNEFFYNIDKHGYAINRFDIGAELAGDKNIRHSLYFKFISRRDDHHWLTESSLVYKLDM